MLVLIIFWGGTVQISNADNPDDNNLTDLGSLLFFTFSIIYSFVCNQLYSFNSLAKRLFLLLVFTFYFLRFLSEIVNPIDVNENLFYLFIFYIASPLFFEVQGIVAAILYFSDVRKHFESE